MNYKAAYYHMFNQLTNLILQLEAMDAQREEMNVIRVLKQIQCEGEDTCTVASSRPARASRSGRS